MSRVRKAATLMFSIAIGLGAVQFAIAGSLRWTAAWIYVGIVLAAMAAGFLYVSRRNPELFAVRMKRHADAKPWDRVITKVAGMATFSMPLVAALQYRLVGEMELPWVIRAVAAVAIAGAFVLSYAAMGVNRHFERNVRIQRDRDHKVIDRGPYRVLRHPSYLASSVSFVAVPLLLGSNWALYVGLFGAALFVARCALEDATLRRELPGYEEYAARVRARLIPGIW